MSRLSIARLRKLGQFAAWTPFLALTLAVSCSRQVSVQDAAGTGIAQPTSPLDDSENAPSESAREDTPKAQNHATDPATGAASRDSHSLPTGTLLTVRLENPLSADSSDDAAGTFNAIVDEPVVLNGTTLVPRGANAAGRVEAARTSTVKRDRGYIRLTLATIDIAGRNLPVQTSSLFARGSFDTPNPSAASSENAVHLDKGRRLTFRLTGPVDITTERPAPSR
jgi:hypothetical protein